MICPSPRLSGIQRRAPSMAACLCFLLLPTAAAAAADEPAATEAPGEVPAESQQVEESAAKAAPQPAYELETVTVTATRNEREVSTAPASVSVITSAELERMPVGDLTDAIRDVPGVSLSAGSQGRRGINIRGMGASYTLILIDGKRVNSNEAVFRHNDLDIGMVPTEAIERIEVVRGSMSSLYGSEALGGVINIVTKPVSNEWRAGIDAKGQTPLNGTDGEELHSSVYVSGPLIQDKLGIRLTGAFDQRLPWRGADNPGGAVLDASGGPVSRPDGSPVYRGDLATLEGRRDHNGRARLVWTPDRRQSIAAEYGQAYQTREGEYYIQSYGVADSRVDRQDFVLSHDGRWEWGSSQLRGYREAVDTAPDELHQQNWVLEGNSTVFFGDHALTFGAEGRWTDLEAIDTFTTSGSASVSQQAIFAQDEYQLTEAVSLLLGGRLDHHENFGLHATPRGYVVYTPVDALTFKGGVGTGFRAPTLRQLSEESIVTSCRGACAIVGNPNLDPERSVSYEVSAAYEPRGWGVGATFFQNDVSDLIDTPRGAGVEPAGQTDEGLDIYLPRNVDKARLRGVETFARVEPLRVLRISLNHTFVESRDVEADEELDNRPRHVVNGQVDWKVGWQLGVFARGQYIGEQKSGDLTLDGYALFDAGLSYRPVETFGLTVGMLNLADARTDSGDGYTYQERGRTLYLGMNARY